MTILKPDKIDKLRDTLTDKPRDLLLFDLATQTGVKLKNLLTLKVKDLYGLNIGDRFLEHGLEPGYHCEPIVSKLIYQSTQRYIENIRPGLDEYLFRSRKGGGPLRINSALALVKNWLDKADIKGPSGANTLRNIWLNHYQSSARNDSKPHQQMTPKKTLKRVVSPPLHELVYEQLSQAIIHKKIQPGELISAEEIANEMGVSRTPVNEALRRLELSGVVTIKPKKGSVVNELSLERALEVLQLRLLIEPVMAETAAKRCTMDTIIRLEKIHQQFSSYSLSVDERIRINTEFHDTIYQVADMPIHLMFTQMLWERPELQRYMFLPQMKGESDGSRNTLLARFIKAHETMLEGMRRRNPVMVCEGLKADGELFLEVVKR